jgi:hypothetical protein
MLCNIKMLVYRHISMYAYVSKYGNFPTAQWTYIIYIYIYTSVVFEKCHDFYYVMLNLSFLRESYVAWEQRRLQITKFQAFGGLLGPFGGHLGSILGTFSAHFGGPERTWKHIAFKRGGPSFGLTIFGPKNCQN